MSESMSQVSKGIHWRSSVWLIVLLFAGPAAGPAGSAESVAPPKPPFIKPLPESAVWTMTVKEKPAESEAAPSSIPLLMRSSVTKKKGIRREIETWSNGRTTERWNYQGMLIFEQPDLQEVSILRGGDPAISKGEFPVLSWLSEAAYQGAKPFEKRMCYYFQREVRPPDMGDLAALVAVKPYFEEAWIDVETGRPVGWNDGSRTWVYTFSAAPDGPLVLPASFQAALDAYEKALAEPLKHTMKL